MLTKYFVSDPDVDHLIQVNYFKLGHQMLSSLLKHAYYPTNTIFLLLIQCYQSFDKVLLYLD